MEAVNQPIVKEIVFIGGGHSHAIALKLLGMNPLPGVRLTLISDRTHTPYSGMLPAYVAGFYSFDETHIDLRPLSRFANAQLYVDRAIGIDLSNQKVICQSHPPVAFDYLSIDIGSTPNKISVKGAQEYTIPVKPVAKFLAIWNQILEKVAENRDQPLTISLVGGGAGGVELALNMQTRLLNILPKEKLTINLFHRGEKLLENHKNWVGKRLETILIERGINVYLKTNVKEVNHQKLIYDSDLNTDVIVESDYIFWVTQASAQSWLKSSGLLTDLDGFILVEDTLQSVSHPHVFATGDIATMVNHPRPKAGVFAVRQGKPLFENIQRIVLGKPLKSFKPQKEYLSLIGTGDKSAIASRGFFALESRLLWNFKDYLDTDFMQRFSSLSPMKATKPKLVEKMTDEMRCAGCGSKIGSNVLRRVLKRLQVIEGENIILGIHSPDDAAVVKTPKDKLMVHTIDYFPSLINDPFLFGQITVNHCLNDLFAMGATADTALAVVTIPYGNEDKLEETLYQLLSGAQKILQETQTSLIGGHTIEGKELAFGLACNGLVSQDKLLRKDGLELGNVLISTKALGTGTLFAADMRYLTKGRWIDNAIESMLHSNEAASKIFLEYGATACTDISGFGLLGHLLEMIPKRKMRIELDLNGIPVLDGAMEALAMGITSSLHLQNLEASNYYISNFKAAMDFPKYHILFDPQTSGSLLAAIPAEKANECLKALQLAGYQNSSMIGKVIDKEQNNQPIVIKYN